VDARQPMTRAGVLEDLAGNRSAAFEVDNFGADITNELNGAC
jgi:hypothetical protein